MNNERYRSLHGYWMFDDPPIAPDLYATIKPLHPDYSASLWTRWVSPTKHHLMLVRDEADRLIYDDRFITSYLGDWDTDDDARIPTLLRSLVPWAPTTPVYFFWSQRVGFETLWSTFVRCWINFTYAEDESDVLISEASDDAIVFCCDNLWAGKRKL